MLDIALSPSGTAALPARGARSGRSRLGLALLMTTASGAAGLGYQIVWTQQAARWLGHEAAAMLAVVAAFFGGLALGALLLGARIERSPRPWRWLAACELLIGAWGLALAWLITPVSAGLLQLIGPLPTPLWQWSVAFAGTLLLLLPATVAMGATLPALACLLARLAANVSASPAASPSAHRRLAWPGGAIGALYAGNTLGAVLGVLASAFWLVPALGLRRTALLCAALNLACALVAWQLRPGARHAAAVPAAAVGAGGRAGAVGLGGLLWLTGALGIGFEVLVVRVLSQVAQNTVYTFAMLLAVYLVGTALGAAGWQRWGAMTQRPQRLAAGLLLWLAATALASSASLWHAPALLLAGQQALGDGYAAALASEALLAVLVFLLPTVVMGALFSQLCHQASLQGLGFARALGLNTLGAAAAPLGFGVLLLPAIGPGPSLLLVAAGYALLAWLLWPAPAPARRLPARADPLRWGPAVLLVLVLAAVALAPPLVFVSLPEGGRLLRYDEGPTAAVSVVQDAQGVMRLRIDNRQQEGSSSSLLADARQALLPLLLHPAPHQALFLGLGTGVTAASAAQDRGLQVTAVELLPEVIAASSLFMPSVTGDERPAGLQLVAADARRFVRASAAQYDLVVSDNFHPARSGSGALYTVEHFQAVRDRLADGGLFCQWLPLHQLDLATLRSIVRSFMAVYPGAFAILASHSLDTPVLGLVAHGDGRRLDPARLRQRLATVDLVDAPAQFGLEDEWAVLGSVVAGPRALLGFAGQAPLNTDDHPVVAHLAPRQTYAPDSTPRERLLSLLAQWQPTPQELLTSPLDPALAQRLARYWSARTMFLQAGREVRPSADVRQMLAQVQQPLLAVLRRSPDFRPAYDPLWRMAQALARQDPAAARPLLAALVQAQPARAEAAGLLQELASAATAASSGSGRRSAP